MEPLTAELQTKYMMVSELYGSLTMGYFSSLVISSAIKMAAKAFSNPKPGGLVKEGLGRLSGNTYEVTQEGIDTIRAHLSKLDYAIENDAMIARLEQALANGRGITGADASFYLHELYEYGLMQGGMDYNAAHEAALRFYNVLRYSVYHPDVLRTYEGWFSDAWFDFWNITRH